MDIDKFIKEGNNKYYIDTTSINKVILNREGVRLENIIDSLICTKCHSKKIHSYRETKEKAGRSSAIIMLK